MLRGFGVAVGESYLDEAAPPEISPPEELPSKLLVSIADSLWRHRRQKLGEIALRSGGVPLEIAVLLQRYPAP